MESTNKVGDMLRNLPCHNSLHFSKFDTTELWRLRSERPSAFVKVEKRGEDKEPPQIIQNDKTNILLRFLKLQREHGESLNASITSSKQVTVPGTASQYIQESGVLAQPSTSGSARKRYAATLSNAEPHAATQNDACAIPSSSGASAQPVSNSAASNTQPVDSKRPRLELLGGENDDDTDGEPK